MPMVVNGIGTWYWGKRNIRVRHDACPTCHRGVDLVSFDTTMFFVVVFVPLIPLKRLRIVDQCPVCTNHRVMSLKDWERARTEGLAAAVKAVQENPTDVDSAMAALSMSVAFQDEDSLLALTLVLEQPMKGNAQVQAALGDCYEFFGHDDQAQESYSASLAIAADAGVKARRASHLLRIGRVDEARADVDEVLAARRLEHAPIAFLAVEAYQGAGRHEDALALLDAIVLAFPQYEKNKDVKGYRAASTKHRASGKAIKSAYARPGAQQEKKDRPWVAKLPWLIGPAVGLIVLVVYLMAAVSMAHSRRVFIVNGLSRGYVVEVGGKQVKLPAQGFASTTVPEGSVTLRVMDSGLSIPEQTVEVSTSLWSRPFLEPTFVINPDRVAVLLWEQDYYAPTGAAPQTTEPERVHAGEAVYRFDGIDYAFAAFPDQLQVPGSSTSVKKERVSNVVLSIETMFGVVDAVGMDGAVALAKQTLALDPHNGDALKVATVFSSPDETREVLEPLLTLRPVVVDAHRMHQTITEVREPARDLVAEYRALLAAEPSNKQLMYLVGRVVPDAAESERLKKAACEGDDGEPRAMTSLVYDYLSNARFEEAYRTAQRCTQYIAAMDHSEMLLHEAMHASGRLEEWLQCPDVALGTPEPAYNIVADQVYVLTRLGRHAEAQQTIDSYCMQLRQEEPAESAKYVESVLLEMKAYVAGDMTALEQAWTAQGPEAAAFARGITSGAAADALKAITSDPEDGPDWISLAAVWIRAVQNNEPVAAEDAMAQMLTVLRDGGADERRIAEYLSAETPPAIEAMETMCIAVYEKKLLLTMMGMRHESLRERCFGMARNINYDRRVPYLLIKGVVGE